MKLRLKYSLALLMMLIAILPAAIVGSLILKHQSDIEKNYHMEQLERLSGTLLNEFNYRFNVLSTSLDVHARDRLLVQAMDDFFLSSHVRATLASLVSHAPLVKAAYLVDKNWEEIENYRGMTGRIELALVKQELNQRIEKGQLSTAWQWVFAYQNEVLVSSNISPSQRGITLVVPIYQSLLTEGLTRQPLGYLIAVIPVESISEVLRPYLKFGEKVELYRDQNQVLVVASDGDTALSDPITLSQQIEIDNEYIANPLSYNAVVYIDRNLKGGELADSLHIILLVIAGLIVLGVFGAAVTYRWITRPLSVLMQMVRSYSRGEYIQKERKLRFAEFYQVGKLFNEMASTIQAQLEDLALTNNALKKAYSEKEKYNLQLLNFNDQLGKKVEEKTEELTHSLQREEKRRKILQSLLAFSAKLQQGDVKEVALVQVANLYPQAGWALKLEGTDDAEWETSGIDSAVLVLLENVKANAEYCYQSGEKSLHCFNLADSQGHSLGMLVMQYSLLEREDFEIISLFVRQLSSAIEGRMLNEELERIAVTDALTELPNRKAFDSAFDRSADLVMRYPERKFGVFIIDVNDLKQANDDYGHVVGDNLLKVVAEALQEACRQTDCVFRLGGDEFAIVVEDGGQKACQVLGRRLEAVRGKRTVLLDSGDSLPIHFALGWASSENTPMDKLFQVADKAMYQDKQAYHQHPNLQGQPS
ncbi:diguanylate cyclase domain-containing protein [Photobacterium lipolyticum]|nr:diguanylate cyclase [Photobacterium lipolyticum]